MDHPHLDAESLIRNAKSFQSFLGLGAPRATDRYFLVTGMTGAGKSLFVSSCTGTKSVEVFEYHVKGKRVYLIDTPGFNDTSRSDVETLETIATYLGTSYENGVRIHGVLVLHPISNNRMSGSNLHCLTLLKAVFDLGSCRNLAIVTTMWPENPDSAEKRVLVEREIELLTKQSFFGDLAARGAQPFKYYEHGHHDLHSQTASARRIVHHLLDKFDGYTPGVLQLQREIVDEKRSLGQTTAGIVAARYLRKARQTHQTRLNEIQGDINEVSLSQDTQLELQLKELEEETKMNLQKVEKDYLKLTKTITEMHQAERKALERQVAIINLQFQNEVKVRVKALQEAQKSYLALQQEICLSSQQPQSQHMIARRVSSQHKNLKRARKGVDKAREDRKKIQEYTREIMGGVMNGLAAGAIAGAIDSYTEELLSS
ncbi:GTP binding domain-containing protein [Fusarium heterosporum]|uniref:GTP binding domain-containing protein n=1 Tax=Fusarium heterosporum TaxID=42747 RepID=A0A8H5TSG3_FUSHE|nr:GTP binding domain-containing protein [Fusarium heterosporum]